MNSRRKRDDDDGGDDDDGAPVKKRVHKAFPRLVEGVHKALNRISERKKKQYAESTVKNYESCVKLLGEFLENYLKVCAGGLFDIHLGNAKRGDLSVDEIHLNAEQSKAVRRNLDARPGAKYLLGDQPCRALQAVSKAWSQRAKSKKHPLPAGAPPKIRGANEYRYMTADRAVSEEMAELLRTFTRTCAEITARAEMISNVADDMDTSVYQLLTTYYHGGGAAWTWQNKKSLCALLATSE
ncbi:hypothetical protein T492DRAFT_1125533 [Pavlovales sp. CCMP2436]|nr:hypothetical protein T492DRAFT_1125533 [Pavlovales sp. CCMP2436]